MAALGSSDHFWSMNDSANETGNKQKNNQQNLTWLSEKYRIQTIMSVEHGDAMTYRWRDPIHAVVSEAYLGQPFSAPPSPAKLIEVKKTCNYIVSEFLKNLAAQIAPGTRLCLAVPASAVIF